MALEVAAAAAARYREGARIVMLAPIADRALMVSELARVLDIGAGTGLLAIAAARTGSVAVVGGDIDATSVRIARENARLNRARVRFVLASGLRHRTIAASAPYDLVFANILAQLQAHNTPIIIIIILLHSITPLVIITSLTATHQLPLHGRTVVVAYHLPCLRTTNNTVI